MHYIALYVEVAQASGRSSSCGNHTATRLNTKLDVYMGRTCLAKNGARERLGHEEQVISTRMEGRGIL